MLTTSCNFTHKIRRILELIRSLQLHLLDMGDDDQHQSVLELLQPQLVGTHDSCFCWDQLEDPCSSCFYWVMVISSSEWII